MNRPWIRWLLLFGWMGLLFRSSATPDLRTVPLVERLGLLPPGLSASDAVWLELLLRKSAHLAAYAVLAVLAAWAMAASFRRAPARRVIGAAFLLALLYAVTDEWHQHFVPTRDGTVADVLIDGVGAGIGLMLHGTIAARRSRR